MYMYMQIKECRIKRNGNKVKNINDEPRARGRVVWAAAWGVALAARRDSLKFTDLVAETGWGCELTSLT